MENEDQRYNAEKITVNNYFDQKQSVLVIAQLSPFGQKTLRGAFFLFFLSLLYLPSDGGYKWAWQTELDTLKAGVLLLEWVAIAFIAFFVKNLGFD